MLLHSDFLNNVVDKYSSENLTIHIKESNFLNTQDTVHLYDNNTITVITTFIPASDTVRVYPALDNICRDFEKIRWALLCPGAYSI